VHTFDAVDDERTCFAWFEGDAPEGPDELIVVLRTSSIASPDAALRAFRGV
jgi:hypothetical protein